MVKIYWTIKELKELRLNLYKFNCIFFNINNLPNMKSWNVRKEIGIEYYTSRNFGNNEVFNELLL